MAAPVVASVSTPNASTNMSSVPANMPADYAAGDLLLAVCVNDVGADDITASGFTELYDLRQGTALRVAAFWRIATGSGDQPTVAGDNQDYVLAILRITGHGVTQTSDFVLPSIATGTSATPDPPASGTVASKDWLSVASFGADFTNSTWTVDSQPSTYTSHVLQKSASSTSSVGFGLASKQLTAATSEDPGTFGISASALWQATTILVPPMAGEAEALASTDARIAFDVVKPVLTRQVELVGWA